MRKVLVLTLGASLLFTLAYANEQSGWSWEYKPVDGTYLVYAGELGNERAPTQNDRKLAVEITGPAAKEVFDSMYPDFQPTCSGGKGDRDRRKGNLYCTFHSGNGYRCFIGLNLRTGKSIAGGTC